jgi:drug/metabolite transporter (DMT)-like permease
MAFVSQIAGDARRYFRERYSDDGLAAPFVPLGTIAGVIVGLAFAVACAIGTSISFLLKHRGAVLAPPVRVRHPLRRAVDLFRSRWFAVGWVVAVGAWALHVGALALAPLSIVQAVLSGGLVFLAVFAERFFGFRLGRRQWAGVIVTAAGLAYDIAIAGSRPKPLLPMQSGGFVARL